MSERREFRKVLYLVALTVFLATSGKAQQRAGKSTPDPASSREISPSSKAAQKPSLLDAARVSTEEAAKSTARKRADKPDGTKAAETSLDDTVTEFHAAPPDSVKTGGTVATTSDKSKKSVLKGVHGTVHGSTAAGPSGGRGGGASLGATSPSGRTQVYVEADHSRLDTPH
jgi:hypothetical protein